MAIPFVERWEKYYQDICFNPALFNNAIIQSVNKFEEFDTPFQISKVYELDSVEEDLNKMLKTLEEEIESLQDLCATSDRFEKSPLSAALKYLKACRINADKIYKSEQTLNYDHTIKYYSEYSNFIDDINKKEQVLYNDYLDEVENFIHKYKLILPYKDIGWEKMIKEANNISRYVNDLLYICLKPMVLNEKIVSIYGLKLNQENKKEISALCEIIKISCEEGLVQLKTIGAYKNDKVLLNKAEQYLNAQIHIVSNIYMKSLNKTENSLLIKKANSFEKHLIGAFFKEWGLFRKRYYPSKGFYVEDNLNILVNKLTMILQGAKP